MNEVSDRQNVLGEFVGLMPAAGKARRLGLPPMSKEVMPLLELSRDGEPRLRAACDVLTERFLAAPVERLLVVVDPEKADLVRHVGSQLLPVPVAFVPRPDSPSLVHSLAAALPFVGGRSVLLGFPDLLFQPTDAFRHLRADLVEHGADLTLALFPSAECRTTDMVGCEPDGRVTEIQVRPETSELRMAWALAAWGPRVSALIQATVDRSVGEGDAEAELQLGRVFQAALAAGLVVRAVPFESGRFLDLGTPQGWARLRDEEAWLRP